MESRTISFNEIEVSKGMFDVVAERARQIDEEGFAPEHDDKHKDCRLATAAACFVLVDFDPEGKTGSIKRRVVGVINNIWPFAPFWWKPRGKRWNLVRAAALIVAEIERLDRLAEEIQEIKDVEKEVYVEAKARGWDSKALRKVVSLMKSEDGVPGWQEFSSIVDLYLASIGRDAPPPEDEDDPPPGDDEGWATSDTIDS